MNFLEASLEDVSREELKQAEVNFSSLVGEILLYNNLSEKWESRIVQLFFLSWLNFMLNVGSVPQSDSTSLK